MSSSSSNFGAFATPLPACDAWGNIRLGTSAVATTLVNGSGISAVHSTASVSVILIDLVVVLMCFL